MLLMVNWMKSVSVWSHLVVAHSLHWQNSFKNSEIEEEAGEYRNVEESLERVLAIYRYLSELFQKGLDVTDEEGDDVTNGIFADAKTETDKTIWMLAAELGQAPGL